MKEEQTFRRVVFLDTNTLHYIRLCLEYAKLDFIQTRMAGGRYPPYC